MKSGTATDISAGNYHSCVIQADTGNVICWGMNNWGQSTPLYPVNGVSGAATAIAAGGSHTLAIALPEPSALTALGSGIAMLALLYRRRRRSAER